MEKTLRRLGFVILTLAVVLLIGAVGYRSIAGYPWFEAFYMTAITVTTVGYREVLPLNRAGEWFTIFVLFSGVSALFFLIGVMTSAVIEQHFWMWPPPIWAWMSRLSRCVFEGEARHRQSRCGICTCGGMWA